MNKKVLLIDDDPEFVEAISNLLDAKNYEVKTASNGEAGMELARSFKPDLILLDIMMTTVTEGIDVSRKIAKDPQINTIPIVMLSGIRKEMNLPFGMEPDADTLPVKVFLEKPVTPDILLKAVEENIA